MKGASLTPEVLRAIDAGELWRAKQLLSGRIGSSRRYDPELYEQYGIVLLRMNDLVLAGKYLFLSGKRDDDYRRAVDLYLRQHGRGGWKTLIGTFPNAVKKLPIDEFPPAVRDELLALGLPAASEQRVVAHHYPTTAGSGGGLRAIGAVLGCVTLAFFIAASLAVGAPIVMRAIAVWFR